MSTEARPDASRRSLRISQGVLAVVVAAVYLRPATRVGLRTDLGAHVLFAEKTSLTGQAFGPFYLFEQLTVLVRALIPFGFLAQIWPTMAARQTIWDTAGVAAMLVAVAAGALAVQHRLLSALPRPPGTRTLAAASAATVVAFTVAPITIFTWSQHQLLTGYISANAYENPTTNALKPIAVVAFAYCVDRVGRGRATWRQVVTLAGLCVLSVHAKPSFASVFVPVAGLVLVTRWARRAPIDWRLPVLGVAVPTVAYLALALAAFPSEGSMQVAPFQAVREVLSVHGQPSWVFAPLAALSAAFPLVVTAAHWPIARRSLGLKMAWAMFAGGIAIFVVFEITGRPEYADLLGGAQIALFLVWVESLRLALPVWRDAATSAETGGLRAADLRGRDRLAAAVLAAHVLCGALLWYQEVVHPAAWW